MIILRNKEFARRDYEGLTPEHAELLRQRRSKLANQLRENIRWNKIYFKKELADYNLADRRAAQERARTYREALLEVQRRMAVKESIAKHKAKAAELRAKKLAGEKLVKNLKTAGKVGLGVAGAAGLGYGIKKTIDKNNKNDNTKK